MNGLRESAESAASALSEAEKKRDLAIAESRIIIRLSKNVIHAIHVGADHDDISKEMRTKMTNLVSKLEGDRLLYTSAADAMMEFAEAEILDDVVSSRPIRGHVQMGITAESWVMGLADSIGEIRRVIVTCLMAGDTARAKTLFAAMEEITEELMLFDVPDGVVQLRRKQDVARGIVEKTRSDMLGACSK